MTEEDGYQLEEMLTELSEEFVDAGDRLSFVEVSHRLMTEFIYARCPAQ